MERMALLKCVLPLKSSDSTDFPNFTRRFFNAFTILSCSKSDLLLARVCRDLFTRNLESASVEARLIMFARPVLWFLFLTFYMKGFFFIFLLNVHFRNTSTVHESCSVQQWRGTGLDPWSATITTAMVRKQALPAYHVWFVSMLWIRIIAAARFATGITLMTPTRKRSAWTDAYQLVAWNITWASGTYQLQASMGWSVSTAINGRVASTLIARLWCCQMVKSTMSQTSIMMSRGQNPCQLIGEKTFKSSLHASLQIQMHTSTRFLDLISFERRMPFQFSCKMLEVLQ